MSAHYQFSFRYNLRKDPQIKVSDIEIYFKERTSLLLYLQLVKAKVNLLTTKISNKKRLSLELPIY